MTVSRKRVIVAGATGFIGRNITESFAREDNYDVVGVWHERPPFECDNVQFVRADLREPRQALEVLDGADIVIQTAATTSGAKDIIAAPYLHVTDNAIMNSVLTRAAFHHNVSRFVMFSCTVMYQTSELALKETDFNANAEMHERYFGAGWTKVYIEKMCEFFSRIGPTQFTAIRHSNIYGPHDKFDLEKSHVLGATVTKVMNSSGGRVIVWGSGEEKRDFLYVDDLIAGLNLALSRQDEKFALYNMGSGHAISVNDLVRTVIELSGQDLRIEHDLSMPTIPTSLHLDCAKAESEIGWHPRIDLQSGLKRTLDWYRKMDQYETDPCLNESTI